MVDLLREIIGSLRLLYILFIVVIGMGGAWLSISPDVHEEVAYAAADAAADATGYGSEAGDQRSTPRGSVAREWERDARDAEREEAIRAAYGY